MLFIVVVYTVGIEHWFGFYVLLLVAQNLPLVG